MSQQPASLRPPLVWVGGKQRYAARLLPLFPAHRAYCEPFCGGAALFFRKERSHKEILNDLNGDLINFYKELQKDCLPFWEMHYFTPASRQLFEKAKETTGQEGFAAAWNFYYRNRLSFAGKGGSYAVQRCGASRNVQATFARMPPWLLAAHERLQGVSLEHLDFRQCLASYDGPETFFYLDPPYLDRELHYRKHFKPTDLGELAALLKKIRGRFLLSINAEAETLFRDFNLVEAFTASYTCHETIMRQARELVFSNYDLPGLAGGIIQRRDHTWEED